MDYDWRTHSCAHLSCAEIDWWLLLKLEAPRGNKKCCGIFLGNTARQGEGGTSGTLVILLALGSQVSLPILITFSLLTKLPENE